ncbi:hypothetical protein DFP93_1074 [Aneurinibacillus soli]|uniref:Uncharacterized protein n=1 Tax=Aneurinibacillus soli TaxID=1500254 RepID=A0A0U5B525_9BACL|nr:hypothetical protein [Aneurinibacillus soli]PYE61615.1 hypothetical protein DFP93_1074 [Aneurinibacillus soli]BAU28527.1 hypothetical protein CB4_02701 [Aneurinibacillus soli]
MDIIHTLGYAVASYIAVYTVLMIIGAILFICFFLYVFRKMKQGDKEYKRMAAANRERQRGIQDSMRERSERFRDKQRKRFG